MLPPLPAARLRVSSTENSASCPGRQSVSCTLEPWGPTMRFLSSSTLWPATRTSPTATMRSSREIRSQRATGELSSIFRTQTSPARFSPITNPMPLWVARSSSCGRGLRSRFFLFLPALCLSHESLSPGTPSDDSADSCNLTPGDCAQIPIRSAGFRMPTMAPQIRSLSAMPSRTTSRTRLNQALSTLPNFLFICVNQRPPLAFAGSSHWGVIPLLNK
mmetsp:Transcript_49907/g.117342  ORF Transcript_49907/g.117342 Transcript_49907/m.117342 type:complete len:218 (+) Transcript_49907:719-1372(+)